MASLPGERAPSPSLRHGVMLRSSPPRTFVLTSRQVVITTSGAFKSLWSEQDGDLTFLHKIKLFSTTLHL